MLEPGSAERPETYLWSDRPPHKREPWPESLPLEPDNRVVLDAGHKVEWGWHVAAYLVTKGIAAGAALLAPFTLQLGLAGFAADWLPEILALAFTLVTTVLLVHDLARPMLFFRLITRPNTKSWLVKGGWILSAFTVLVSASIAARWLGYVDVANALRWVDAVLALGVAGYTAFLFKQCEGRDLWQGDLVLPHLLVQAALCGAAALIPFSHASKSLAFVLAASLVLHSLMMVLELRKKHATANARQAAAFLPVVELGVVKHPFALANVLGVALPALAIAGASIASLAPSAPLFFAIAGVAALCGLYFYESAFVRAGQLPPLS
jgi:formate-dependent nitrite reductase membrane component NrfD